MSPCSAAVSTDFGSGTTNRLRSVWIAVSACAYSLSSMNPLHDRAIVTLMAYTALRTVEVHRTETGK
jgi:hypothetical protein